VTGAYGWRARVGLVVPANNQVLEPELYSVAPAGVAFHTSRLALGTASISPAALEAMERQTDRALAEVAQAGVGVAVYACLSTSLVKGRAWDERFGDRLRDGAPAVRLATVARSVVEALCSLGARRIAVASPYPPPVAALVAGYFAAWGLGVQAEAHLPTEDVRAVGAVTPAAVYRLARELAPALRRADALVILATDLATFPILAALEADLGRPVVTANQAALWWAFRESGVAADGPALGRLFQLGA
jgi:maleate isomerase